MVPVISTNELRKVYRMGDNEVHALRGVSIDVYEGEMVSIMGPSGSGKSTLMAILGALDLPSSGSYLLDKQPVQQLNDSELADIRNQRIGFVFQKFNLLPRSSIEENVALPLIYAGISEAERLERARHSLELVGLGDRLGHKPTELSGGQQQRVAVARALVNDPAIILADEPTGNLDSRTGDEIMALFKTLHSEQGITLVIVTHDAEVMWQTERVIYLRDGELSDPPKELASHAKAPTIRSNGKNGNSKDKLSATDDAQANNDEDDTSNALKDQSQNDEQGSQVSEKEVEA
jgi:putative ABC transport system ATP-binding protein